MTSQELFNKMRPSTQKEFLAQLLTDGLNLNLSDIFCPLVKDAARCNSYQSDIYYDMVNIHKRLKEYKEGDEFEPIWVGFRKHGVDGTGYVLARTEEPSMYGSTEHNYFALYSITLKKDSPGWYYVVLSEYWM